VEYCHLPESAIAVLDLVQIEPPKPLPWYATAAGQTGVTIAALLAIATVVGTSTAVGEENVLFNSSPTYPVDHAIEKLTSYPSSAVTPIPGQEDAAERLARPAKTVLAGEPGGLLSKHEFRFKMLSYWGGNVEIRGMCQSACTLVMSNIAREHICFSASGYLNFHLASINGKPSIDTTLDMINSYPSDIRAWLNAKGGAWAMPFETFWTLRAPELWKMGYRKCD
jgi:hypothetical protein